ncbi:SDR family NAD(P)-dependent oxidoreductase [Yinghuangia seranimata]|uniref:SDR family NAD(P)-dependent oxidoreductase n=1 Tax=Yinghuangia seranimata TaxID=408067 RepID=UPI00248D2EFD|nr:SDR family oxidoreductase [Yinghuangia seranimata]MDI2125400.1 SDR family oxidoreductase [Yinghuangia seranimata]
MAGPTARAYARRGTAWFRDRTALVTGGSRGLGLLVARELAALGARVAVCARDEAELARAADTVRLDTGRTVSTHRCDVSRPDDVEALVAELGDRYGGVDALVNNAGIISVGPVECTSPDQYEAAMDVMFAGPMRLTLALLPGMRARGDGRIVNITSLGGRVAAPHLLPYSAAKFAAVGFSEGLRAELAGAGIAVTTVLPGLMRTGSYRAARFGGRHEREFAWFAAAASLPLLSMDAERAARAVVRAAARGRPEVVLTVAAKAAVRMHGLAPATTVRMLGLAGRLLPAPPDDDTAAAAGADVPGTVARAFGQPAWSRHLTGLGEQAARRWNEPHGV